MLTTRSLSNLFSSYKITNVILNYKIFLSSSLFGTTHTFVKKKESRSSKQAVKAFWLPQNVNWFQCFCVWLFKWQTNFPNFRVQCTRGGSEDTTYEARPRTQKQSEAKDRLFEGRPSQDQGLEWSRLLKPRTKYTIFLNYGRQIFHYF